MEEEDIKKFAVEQPIVLSDEALQKAITLRQTNKEWVSLDLRVYIEGKGCDGFTYGVSFDSYNDGDLSFELNSKDDFKLICDKETFQFIRGSRIEWVNDERGTGFLVENPRHKRFRGKFYRRGYWRKKMQEKELAKESD